LNLPSIMRMKTSYSNRTEKSRRKWGRVNMRIDSSDGLVPVFLECKLLNLLGVIGGGTGI
jgi:hypothetical protein